MSFKWHKQDSHRVNKSDNTQCTSLFIEPVSWMLPILEGTVDGKVIYKELRTLNHLMLKIRLICHFVKKCLNFFMHHSIKSENITLGFFCFV